MSGEWQGVPYLAPPPYSPPHPNWKVMSVRCQQCRTGREVGSPSLGSPAPCALAGLCPPPPTLEPSPPEASSEPSSPNLLVFLSLHTTDCPWPTHPSPPRTGRHTTTPSHNGSTNIMPLPKWSGGCELLGPSFLAPVRRLRGCLARFANLNAGQLSTLHAYAYA